MRGNNTVVSVFGFQPSRIGAGEIFARELSMQLDRAGWKSVLCFLGPPEGAVHEFLEGPNVSIEILPDSWRLAWRPTMELSRLLSKYAPRVLHLYFTGFIGPYPWLGRLQSVEQIYFTDQGSRPEGFAPARSPLWKRTAARIINAPLDKVVCVSDYGLRCFTALDLLPAGRFTRIYNCVDIERAASGFAQAGEFRRKHAIPAGRTVVTQVSSMIPEKGILDFLDAAKRVLARNGNVHFLLAGDGTHRRAYIERAASLSIAADVTFTGVVRDPLAEGVYAASDIGCQVSRWEEVFGYVIAEAMASRRPILGTRVGGIPELIEDGVSGYLVDRGDTAAMADRLLALIADPALRHSMGDAGYLAADKLFNVRKNAAEFVRLYGI